MSQTIEARWEQHNEAGRRYFGEGDAIRAEQAFTSAIREAAALGPESLQLASSLSNLGQLKYRQRDFDKAEALFRRSLAIREHALGPDHYGLVQSINNLAALHYAREEFDAAETLFQRALVLSERHFEGDQPDVAVSLNNLARLYFRRNNYEAAAPLLMRLLSIKERAQGSNDPEVAVIVTSLAKVRMAGGEYDAAEQLARRALLIRERTPGPSHQALAASIELLADVCAARGKTDEAARLRARQRTLDSSTSTTPAAAGVHHAPGEQAEPAEPAESPSAPPPPAATLPPPTPSPTAQQRPAPQDAPSAKPAADSSPLAFVHSTEPDVSDSMAALGGPPPAFAGLLASDVAPPPAPPSPIAELPILHGSTEPPEYDYAAPPTQEHVGPAVEPPQQTTPDYGPPVTAVHRDPPAWLMGQALPPLQAAGPASHRPDEADHPRHATSEDAPAPERRTKAESARAEPERRDPPARREPPPRRVPTPARRTRQPRPQASRPPRTSTSGPIPKLVMFVSLLTCVLAGSWLALGRPLPSAWLAEMRQRVAAVAGAVSGTRSADASATAGKTEDDAPETGSEPVVTPSARRRASMRHPIVAAEGTRRGPEADSVAAGLSPAQQRAAPAAAGQLAGGASAPAADTVVPLPVVAPHVILEGISTPSTPSRSDSTHDSTATAPKVRRP